MFSVWLFSLKLSIASSTLALVVGIIAGGVCLNNNSFAKRFLLRLGVVPECLPSLIMALGFVGFFGNSGVLYTMLKSVFGIKNLPVSFLYSFWGLVIAHGFYNFPLIMTAVYDRWQQIPPTTKEAALVLGATRVKTFFCITLSDLVPSILKATLIVFLYCYFSFMIVLLFGGTGCTTLEVELYRATRGKIDIKRAFCIASLETLTAGAIVFLYTLQEKKAQFIKGASYIKQKNTFFLKNDSLLETLLKTVFQVMFWAIIGFFFLAPLFCIALDAFSVPGTSGASCFVSFSIKNFIYILGRSSFWLCFFNTVAIATVTGVLCVAVSFFYCMFLVLNTKAQNNFVFKILPLLPLCVSPVVLGFLFVLLTKKGNILVLVICQVSLMWPLSFGLVLPSMQKITKDVIMSAKVLGASFLRLAKRIFFDNCKKSIISGFCFCFAASCADTTLPLVLAVPNFSNLSLMIYQLASTYRLNLAGACSIILAAICILVFSFAKRKSL